VRGKLQVPRRLRESSIGFVRPRLVLLMGILLVGFFLSGCRRSPEPVTITFLDPEGLPDLGRRHLPTDAALEEFTHDTGIRVNHLPAPEDNREHFLLVRKLLQQAVSTPDVYGIDCIWSGALSDYLVDLKPYLSSELPLEVPEILSNYMVHGKLVAIPYHPNFGVLYYRTDLLLKYGYSNPPRTWDELEKMAVRIQMGERAEGKKDFWGFVWPGSISEGFASTALEWQASAGGGRIIENDQRISVNNPNALRAWDRAAHWIGWISPPSVLAYEEWDASNAFWISGRVAFTRGWSDYLLLRSRDVPFRDHAGMTSVPGEKNVRVSTFGGFSLGVSRSSAHQPEAIRLVQFLARREAQVEASSSRSEIPKLSQIFEAPRIVSKIYPTLEMPGSVPGAEVVERPSTVTGANYDAVSLAYVQALHPVLGGQAKSPEAAAALEKQLVRITGFEPVRK
jgi:trehalose/maltose transport system substrate-binding protein